MADPEIKISELTAADQANATDLLETSQVQGTGWVTKKITLDQVSTVVAASDQITDVIDEAIDAVPLGDYVLKAGDTMTGPLNGTLANFSGSITASSHIITNGGAIIIDRAGDATFAQMQIRTDAGQQGSVDFYTGTSTRWQFRKTATAEGGANAGSDFAFYRYSDAGALLGAALSMNRATGAVDIPALTGATGTFSGSISTTGGIIRAGNPPTTGYVLLNPGGAVNAGYIAFHQADNDRIGFIGFNNTAMSYTAELAGSFHTWIGPGSAEWMRLTGAANAATLQLGVGTEIGIVQLDATGNMYVRSQKAATSLYLGAAGANGVFVQSSGIFPITTGVQALGNSAFTWGSVWANSLVANGAAGTNRTTFYDTAASHRWAVRASLAAEGGSNAGSDYFIDRYNDAGAYIDSPFSINRATGVSNFNGALTGTSITLSGGMTVGVGQRYTFSGRGYIDPLADGLFGLSNAGATAGVRLDVGTAGGTLRVLNAAGGADNAKMRIATPAPGTNDDTMVTAAFVQAAITAALAASVIPAGTVVDLLGAVAAPTGWVLAINGTIGNAASGATIRANADCANLFAHLWTLANTEAPVSGGRGASAAADFAANKTIGGLDCRGAARATFDSLGGTAANRLTTLFPRVGMIAGDQAHALVTAELAAHSHGVTDPGHSHTILLGNATTSPVQRGGYGDGNNQALQPNVISNGGTGISIQNAGSGTAHNNVQATRTVTTIIKL